MVATKPVIDTRNIWHTHAFAVLRDHPFEKWAKRLGGFRLEYVNGDAEAGDILVILFSGRQIGLGSTVRRAMDDAVRNLEAKVPDGCLF